ncbi:two-component system response regulator YesN [Paenibacillus phyllosphaerae]|uniref:Two-component system response regulator YesN n=1 Tax=Paenibacillus phyllosphaerae TaxID=274593 RepID=A0A7W5B588_9BACL|nr:response regulator [Paenibacillus phyllosphaerae]MBB3114497.1 two-component system response regulator YesN [Paenibacillus phyllosphaerae]
MRMRLLIVDDEPYIVDGLKEMLVELEDLELELFTAYSSEEAIERMKRTKMDIVLSDIRMPGMDGLALQRWVEAHWPRCKVIFLSGMGDFHYVQQAIRHGGVDYILKTEGDEAIEAAVRQAMKQITEEAVNEAFLKRAKDQLWQALPLLRKDWFYSVIDARTYRMSISPARLAELHIPFITGNPILMVAGRADRWQEDESGSAQMLLLYAIQNIAEEYLQQRAAIVPLILDGSHFVWLLQPRVTEQADEPVGSEQWEADIRFIIGTLESIQATIKQLLRIPVSIVTNGSPVSWEELGATYARLKQMLVLGLGDGCEMLITYCDIEEQETVSDLSDRWLLELEQVLDSGDLEQWNTLIDARFGSARFRNYAIYSQAYYCVALMLLRQLNASGEGTAPDGEQAKRLMDLHAHPSKESAVAVLKACAWSLIEQRRRSVDERTHRIIQKLNQHIRANLDQDLSLDALSAIVYLNSSYLSSLYKLCTGMNVTEYMADLRIQKAKELLAGSMMKIHEVGAQVGYGTAGYFTRFFKKHTGMTPQEYRALHE